MGKHSVTHHKMVAYMLWFLSIFGLGGVHRFYTGHLWSGVGLLLLGLFTRSAISAGGFGGIFLGLLLGAAFTIWSFCDLYLIPRLVQERYGLTTIEGSKPPKRIPSPSPAPKVSLTRNIDDLIILYRELFERYTSGSRPVPKPVPKPQSLSQRIVKLARDEGQKGFSLNDAVIAFNLGPEEIRPELEKLMDQFLIEVYNDEQGRILYREPQSPTG